MNKLKEIEQTVLTLSDNEFQALYHWIVELGNQRWDEQIEKDSADGLLDDMANQAIVDHKKGLSRKL
jgi:hypothetical protein